MPREFKDYRKFSENRGLRSWAFRIHGYKCAKCGNKKLVADLVVHHRVYRNCEEKPEDVVILCKYCHIDLHRRQKLFQLTLDDIPLVDPGWKEMIEEYVATGKQKRRYCVDLKMIGLYEFMAFDIGDALDKANRYAKKFHAEWQSVCIYEAYGEFANNHIE
jgi:hypothetical protein